MGFCEILSLIFVVLKLVGVITWSWWFVFLPVLVAIGFYVLIVILGICGVSISTKKINKYF